MSFNGFGDLPEIDLWLFRLSNNVRSFILLKTLVKVFHTGKFCLLQDFNHLTLNWRISKVKTSNFFIFNIFGDFFIESPFLVIFKGKNVWNSNYFLSFVKLDTLVGITCKLPGQEKKLLKKFLVIYYIYYLLVQGREHIKNIL